ncbi:hypothetical protein Syun_029467 [Stephania yunnanensis]|uniref:Uncharacterized protein n=1 Tax=Stephania yunnanensis TaxID=152371 RepID=A0AAP0HG19_9MAGN
MPFPMKIQPIDSTTSIGSIRSDPIKPAVKSRFKRLFERQFTSVLRSSTAEKPGEAHSNNINSKDGSNGGDLEPSSVCLAKMVQSFIEEANESKASKCGRNRCNCFNRNCSYSSDDELDFFGGFGDSLGANAGSSGEGCEFLKSLVSCATIAERNLFADTAKIVEMNKSFMGKDSSRTIVTDGLLGLCYDASICKSKWEKSPSYPAGWYNLKLIMMNE